ncbi:MAG: formyltransferase [Sterolibacterium sp.]|nr:formyltransferase [Sterolibacterium sp.]MBP9798503.1 formyltransferase [Sterolibacterium sp.]
MPRAVVFAYHNVGVRCLSVLLAHGVDIALVVTHQDASHENIWFDSVAGLATLHGIPFITPEVVNDPAVVARIAALEPDFFFSFYFRQMLKADLLAIPRQGAWNMHGSLLPKYRGRVPVNWAVLHGERETGATLHRMLEKPDAGGILAQQVVPILPDDTAHEVFQKVTVAAEMALSGILPQLLSGSATEYPQDLTRGSYFGGRQPEDGRLDWQQPAQALHNLVRAVAPPYPGAFCATPLGELRILKTVLPRTVTTLPQPSAAATRPALSAMQLYEGRLGVRCSDGRLLQIVVAELAGQPLDAASFSQRCGTTLPLY